MTKDRPVKILLTGASFSGNLGAEAMYDSIVDELRKYIRYLDIYVLSKYPLDDEEGCQRRGYKLISFPTIYQFIFGGWFYIFGGLLKMLHLPHRWMAGKRMEAFYACDILVDASGISFTDDRTFLNVLINTLWFLPGVISGIPMVKVSQSLGPYKKNYVRILANMVMKHMDVIICRGQTSYDYTRKFLKSPNIYNLPDTAFCLVPEDQENTSRILKERGLVRGKYIAVGPSFVMRDYMEKDVYVELLINSIEELGRRTDMPFVLIPHSWQHSIQFGVDSVNEDYSVCRSIAEKLSPEIPCVVIDVKLSAREFKSIIGDSYMAIGSRYHFLVASLSSGVPSMALGWSHKYRELFAEFDISDYVLEYWSMDKESVLALAIRLYLHRNQLYEKINNVLNDVKMRSAQNEMFIVKCLEAKGILNETQFFKDKT